MAAHGGNPARWWTCQSWCGNRHAPSEAAWPPPRGGAILAPRDRPLHHVLSITHSFSAGRGLHNIPILLIGGGVVPDRRLFASSRCARSCCPVAIPRLAGLVAGRLANHHVAHLHPPMSWCSKLLRLHRRHAAARVAGAAAGSRASSASNLHLPLGRAVVRWVNPPPG